MWLLNFLYFIEKKKLLFFNFPIQARRKNIFNVKKTFYICILYSLLGIVYLREKVRGESTPKKKRTSFVQFKKLRVFQFKNERMERKL